MICDICKRGSRGLAFYPPGERRFGGAACSMKCLEVIVQKHKTGEPFLPDENAAIEAGGREAGAFLESIGKSDLAELTQDEWMDFLRTFEAARSEHLRNAIPF